MSLFRNVISKLGNQVQQTAETVGQTLGQTVGQTVGKRVTQSLDAALSSRLGHAVGEAWQKTLGGVSPGQAAGLPAWSAKEFEKQIRTRLKPHTSQHPFIRKLKAGLLNQTQVHVWLANEWYFQQNLPLKDAAILSNCEDAAFRRMWTRRLLEQDGGDSGIGAVEHWARLSTSLGLDTETLHDMTLVTPGVRFAVDTYVNFARRAPWTEAVCASLGEFLSADYLRDVFETLQTHYGKPDEAAVAFFTERGTQQRKDWDNALQALNDYFKTREDQDYALDILQFKQDILWTCLDSVSLSPLAQDAPDGEDATRPAIKGEPPQRVRRKKQASGQSARNGKSSEPRKRAGVSAETAPASDGKPRKARSADAAAAGTAAAVPDSPASQTSTDASPTSSN